MKKIISLVLAVAMLAALALTLASCNTESTPTTTPTGTPAGKTYKVGICQLVQHPALDSATKGFKDALVEILGEGNVTFDEQNASGDGALCTTICNTFVNNKVDLIMANATAALQAAANSTLTIPVLGTSITEYGVALGLENFEGTVGGNISGTSDLADLEAQAQMIIDLVPDVKTVGIVYCSAEPNSAYQVNVVKTYLQSKNITVNEYPFTDSNDVHAVSTTAAQNSDALYIPTDNTAASCAETIGNVIRNAKKPLIAGEQGICASCGIATLSIDYYDLGYKTGEMAAQILKGEADISTMPIAYAEAAKMYNEEMCNLLGITIPEGFTKIEK